MLIRDIGIADTPAVVSLIQAKAKFDGCLASLNANEQSIKDAFFSDTPKACAIGAEIDGKLVGLATYYSIYSTFIAKPGIWLDDLYVYEHARQSGAGKALMRRLCQIAKDSGCGRIDWIVARDNDHGLGFYHSIGAHIFEDVRHARLDEQAINQLLSPSS